MWSNDTAKPEPGYASPCIQQHPLPSLTDNYVWRHKAVVIVIVDRVWLANRAGM
jgi:hypothetical protein